MLLRFGVFLVAVTLVFAQGRTATPARTAPRAAGRLVADKFVARSLQGNLVGDEIERKVLVYLPPTYEAKPQQRYPVVYLLHAYGFRIESWNNGRLKDLHIKDDMDRLIAANTIREMIIVMPDSRNHYAGSHYANSSVTGAWADAIARDLVEHIDRNYRTIAASQSRGIAGNYMGGSGAVSLAMEYPGVYGCLYGLSSAKMDYAHESPIRDEVWRKVLELEREHPTSYEFKIPEEVPALRAISYATAYSPNPDRRPFLADLPVQLVDGELHTIPEVWQKWLAHDPIVLLKTHAGNLRALRAFRLDCDTADPNLEANRRFDKELRAAKVPHTYEEYAPHSGDDPHYGHIGERITTHMLPFFSNQLTNHP